MKSRIADGTFALVRLRRAVQRVRRACVNHGDARATREATAKLAYQLHEATMPSVAACQRIYDKPALIMTATRVVFLEAPMEELQLPPAALLKVTAPQLARAIDQDREAMLDQSADGLADSPWRNATREYWAIAS